MLDCNCFKIYYKIVPPYADSKAIKPINYTTNLDRPTQIAMYFIVEEETEIVLDFSKWACWEWECCNFNLV